MNFSMRYFILGGVILLSLLLFSCSTAQQEYENTSPTFDLKTYFNGSVTAWGILQNYNNKVTRRFCVDIVGTWDENNGILAETFYFDDGEISYRTWQLTKLPNDQYTGTAEDVVGTAVGKQTGYAFRWQYKLTVPIDETSYTFDMDDWMFQLDEYRVMNKTTMSKLGVDVAEITLFFDKQSQKKSCR